MSVFNYEQWIGEQSEEIKAGIEAHYQGILNTAKATRQERDDLDKKLKRLAKEVEVGSDAEKTISEMRGQLANETKRANFFEGANKQGIKNAKLAFALANTDNLYTDEGTPDWDKIKENAPELFNAQAINSNAGSGTNQRPAVDSSKAVRDALKTSGTIKIKS